MNQTRRTSIGIVSITQDGEFITRLEIIKNFSDSSTPPTASTALLNEAFKQLEEYLEKKRKIFELPLKPTSSIFTMRVLDELKKVPYATFATYSDIAKRIDMPKASRAVGSACRANPIPIFIPCHRIISKTRKLTGFALGLDIKKVLLDLEEINYAK